MFNLFRIAFLLAGPLTLSVSPAWAKSGTIKLTDVFGKSETVAIVKLVELPLNEVPRKARLNVLRVLKGHLGTGEQEVSYAEYDIPNREPGEFVAFLDKQRQWRYSAAPLQGTNADSGLLFVSAFDVMDAPQVSPEFLSLAQLKDYLKTGTLIYSFRGPVWFPQRGKIPWAPSGMRIEGTYDAVRDTAQVTGLGQLSGFTAEPKFDVISWGRKQRILLRYAHGGNRPLEFHGEVERLDQRIGVLIAKFAVMMPGVLSEATLKKYLANPELGTCSYNFRLRCLATKDYPKLNLLLSLSRDRTPHLKGWGSGPLEIDTFNLNIGDQTFQMLRDVPGQGPSPVADPPSNGVLRFVTESRETQTVVLDFNLAKPTNDKDALGWQFLGAGQLQSELLYRVNSGPVHGTLSLYDGKALRAITNFSVHVDPVVFGPVYGK